MLEVRCLNQNPHVLFADCYGVTAAFPALASLSSIIVCSADALESDRGTLTKRRGLFTKDCASLQSCSAPIQCPSLVNAPGRSFRTKRVINTQTESCD